MNMLDEFDNPEMTASIVVVLIIIGLLYCAINN